MSKTGEKACVSKALYGCAGVVKERPSARAGVGRGRGGKVRKVRHANGREDLVKADKHKDLPEAHNRL